MTPKAVIDQGLGCVLRGAWGAARRRFWCWSLRKTKFWKCYLEWQPRRSMDWESHSQIMPNRGSYGARRRTRMSLNRTRVGPRDARNCEGLSWNWGVIFFWKWTRRQTFCARCAIISLQMLSIWVFARYQDVTRFVQYRRAAKSMVEYLAKFDLLRRDAESRVRPGGSSPEAFTSIGAISKQRRLKTALFRNSADPDSALYPHRALARIVARTYHCSHILGRGPGIHCSLVSQLACIIARVYRCSQISGGRTRQPRLACFETALF